VAHTLTTHAVVLRSIPYRDHHRLLTLFSPEYGRITAAAHGTLGAKSRLRAASVPFANGEFVLTGQGAQKSVSAFMPDVQYYGGMSDYDTITHASVLGGFCLTVIQEEQPNPTLYKLLLESLAYFNFGEYTPQTVLCAYLLQMLDDAGFAPELENCTICGAVRGVPMLSFEAGGLCCRNCKPSAAPIPRGSAGFLRAARQGQINAIDPEDARMLLAALITYAHDALGQPLPAVSLLDL